MAHKEGEGADLTVQPQAAYNLKAWSSWQGRGAPIEGQNSQARPAPYARRGPGPQGWHQWLLPAHGPRSCRHLQGDDRGSQLGCGMTQDHPETGGTGTAGTRFQRGGFRPAVPSPTDNPASTGHPRVPRRLDSSGGGGATCAGGVSGGVGTRSTGCTLGPHCSTPGPIVPRGLARVGASLQYLPATMAHGPASEGPSAWPPVSTGSALPSTPGSPGPVPRQEPRGRQDGGSWAAPHGGRPG
jgi:hypothetical protein